MAWSQTGNIKGPTGAQGPKGDTGGAGPHGAPSAVPGPTGPAGADSVVPGHDGPQGNPGIQGIQGQGLEFLTAVATVGDLPTLGGAGGLVGDVHLVNDDGKLYTPIAGAWTAVGHVQGPVGPAGADGIQGPGGPHGPTGPAGTTTHAGLTDVTADQHHVKYTDAEAVTAMGAEADGNPLNHRRFTRVEVLQAMGGRANSNELNHNRYKDGDAVNAQGIEANSNPLRHARYADTEAVAAVKAAGLTWGELFPGHP